MNKIRRFTATVALLLAATPLFTACDYPKFNYAENEAAPKKLGDSVRYPDLEQAILRADKRVFKVNSDRALDGLTYDANLWIDILVEPGQLREAVEVETNVLEALKTKYPGDVNNVTLKFILTSKERTDIANLKPVMYVGDVVADSAESGIPQEKPHEFIAPDGAVYHFDNDFMVEDGILYENDRIGLFLFSRAGIDDTLAEWQRVFSKADGAKGGEGGS